MKTITVKDLVKARCLNLNQTIMITKKTDNNKDFISCENFYFGYVKYIPSKFENRYVEEIIAAKVMFAGEKCPCVHLVVGSLR